MGKRIWCCVAVAVGIQAQAQTQPPKVIGVANDPWSSPTLSPGAIGYVFGSNFGTARNTTITIGGLNAPVLDVSSNQIRALFPPNLPAGLATLTVTVDGEVSETVNVIVSARVRGRISSRRGSVSAGPAFRFSPTPVPEPPVYPPSFSHPLTARAPTGGGIVYTCDSTVNATSSTACNTLNTTIAALYSSAFTNANASIYVKLGSTGLGMSDYVLTDANYSPFRNLLIASESDANDVTAVTDSVPATNPFGSDQVELPNALQRALGFGTPDTGLLSDGTTFCTLGTAGCYDGVITVSNAVSLYFRSGSILSNQYDFFTVVEHETDEILGTASCAIYGLCSGVVDPPDFFRYHSKGTRSTLAAGTNDPCSSSDSTNACFSLDSIHMLQQYNNVNNGEDAGDWVPSCASPLVQDAALCAGTAGVDISPAAEILVLDVVGYTLAAVSGAVTNVTSSTPNGTYGVGASISIQITFNETVTVTGAPQLALNSGGTATYSSGSGTGTLAFIYVVAAGQNSILLDYTSTGSLTLNGGSIKGPGNAAVNLTLAAPGTAGSLSSSTDIVINTSSPTNITFRTNPSGLQFSVDGGAAQIAPRTLSLTQGSHTMAVATTQSGSTGTQYVFTSWSDGGAASHSIVVGGAAVTYTASFKTQYQLTTSASPAAGGTVTPVSGGFYDAGTVVPVTAVANAGYVFIDWSGSVANATSAATTVTMTAPMTVTANFSDPLRFYPIAPCRLVDTRVGQGKSGAFGPPALAAFTDRNFPLLSGGCSIPSTAQAYSLNFTVVPDGPLGFLSAWPTGDAYPGVSTLNSIDGSVIANAAIVPAGTGGSITVVAGDPTDLIIDINGYFAPPGTSGLEFFPLTPCRIADTRSTQGFTGAFGPPSLAGFVTRDFPLATSPCLSGSEQAYSLNVTAVPPGPLGFLSIWPVGQPYPGVSTLNSPDGTTLANAAIVPAGTGGDINVVAGNPTDVIIDINGKFAAPGAGGLQFYTVTPCRVADTRTSQNFTGQFGPPSLAAFVDRNFPIQSSTCGIPLNAEAYALNMTVVPAGPLSFLSAWPAGQAYPGVSTLNSPDGFVIANAAIVPAGTGTGAAITVVAGNPTDLIIDIVGYFAP